MVAAATHNPRALKLGGRLTVIPEPVFRVVRIVVAEYNRAVGGDDATKLAALDTIIRELTGGKVPLKRLSAEELGVFLAELPRLCGLKPANEGGITRATDWGMIYFHLSACFGWDYDYIDNHMTLSRLDECNHYNLKHPPTHQLVASYLGYEHKERSSLQGFMDSLLANAKAKGVIN